MYYCSFSIAGIDFNLVFVELEFGFVLLIGNLVSFFTTTVIVTALCYPFDLFVWKLFAGFSFSLLLMGLPLFLALA